MKIKFAKFFLTCCFLKSIATTTFMATCQTDSDCSALYNSKYLCIKKKCQHESIFPLDQKKIFGIIAIILVSALANAGGIGGGEIIVPVYIFLFSQTVSDAIPLSKATIFAGAFINFLMIFRNRNPYNKHKLLIDYKISSFIIPLVLAGTMIGVLLTKLLPPLLIFAMLVLYITQTTYEIFFKAKKLWDEENEVLKDFKCKVLSDDKSKRKLEVVEGNYFEDHNRNLEIKDFDRKEIKIKDCENFSYDLKNTNKLKQKEKSKIENFDCVDASNIDYFFKKQLVDQSNDLSVEQDNSFTTKSTQEQISNNSFSNKSVIKSKNNNNSNKKETIFNLFRENIYYIFIAVITYIILLAISLLRGGKGFHSLIGINTCSIESWSLFISAQILTILISFFIFTSTKKKITEKKKKEKTSEKKIKKETISQSEKISIKSESEKSKNQKITKSPEDLTKLKKLGLLSYTTGILAGSLGIGGGIIMNPVLLQLGYQPEIAAAISSFLVLFTSLSTSSQFLIVGAFDFNYAFVIFIFSAVGSFFGNLVIMKLLRKYKRPSLIVWVLFFLLLLSLIVLPPVGFFKILEQERYLTFGSPC